MDIYGLGILFLLTGVLSQTLANQEDWSICPPKCRCKWASNRKTAECANEKLTSIPTDLSPEIQTADLHGNSFHSLKSEAFKTVGLVNLHKIYLKGCGIHEVHKDAFKGLQILIELDLSDNQIHSLHPGTFRDNIRLRIVILNKNPIQKLEDGLFTNLSYLQTVEFGDCELSHVSYKTFNNVSSLQNLVLRGNNLSHMKLSVVDNLVKLRSLVLDHNPWRCDCHLRALRDWVIEKKLYTEPTSCSEPPHLQGRLWNEVGSDEFACKPQITYPPLGTSISADNEDVTLSCRVIGNPSPDVHWVFNSRIIANNTRNTYGDLRYTVRSSGDTNKWVNLTISRVRSQDRGEFTCVARSPGGIDERNVTLMIRPVKSGYGPSGSTSDSWPLIIGLVIGTSSLIIICFLLCCCLYKKRETPQGKKTPGNGVSPNGDIIHHIAANTEQEKRLLTVVNPIQKQSRRYDSQGSSNNGGTELSELNRNLLDDGSTLASTVLTDEDNRSMRPGETGAGHSRDKLDPDTYPPDLIAFPGRGTSSPAGSSASTAMDTSRLTPHITSHSPLHSPIYHPGFGTLPYSRSQSPFSPVSASPVVLQRQGYVTIPRRPRVPSWSSAPTPTLQDDPLSPVKPEPVYDNLGPRTTADGSSALSLNKLSDSTPRAKPPAPPTKPRTAYSTLEREPSAIQPIAPLSPSDRRWTPPPRPVGLTGLKRIGSADGPISLINNNPPTFRPKVAPKPPPKPKKGNLPLYEDEGEDGTEV